MIVPLLKAFYAGAGVRKWELRDNRNVGSGRARSLWSRVLIGLAGTSASAFAAGPKPDPPPIKRVPPPPPPPRPAPPPPPAYVPPTTATARLPRTSFRPDRGAGPGGPASRRSSEGGSAEGKRLKKQQRAVRRQRAGGRPRRKRLEEGGGPASGESAAQPPPQAGRMSRPTGPWAGMPFVAALMLCGAARLRPRACTTVRRASTPAVGGARGAPRLTSPSSEAWPSFSVAVFFALNILS